MSNALRIAGKTLREYLREPQLFLILLLGPVVLVALFYFAFQPARQQVSTILHILVLNQDEGASGGRLVDAIRAMEFEGEPAFTVIRAENREAAIVTLREGRTAMLLVVPGGFSAAIEATRSGQPPSPPPEVEYVGDPTSMNFILA